MILLGWDVDSKGILRAALPKDLRTLKLRADFSGCKDWSTKVPWVRDMMKAFFENGRGA